MGTYTEFYFRANIIDGQVADWLDNQINGDEWFKYSFSDHKLFTLTRWTHVFIGEGAVYQESRTPIFRRKTDIHDNQIVLSSSMKNYNGEIEWFIDWITPHLDMSEGEFLGYSLYEDTWRTEDDGLVREHPTMYFHKRLQVL